MPSLNTDCRLQRARSLPACIRDTRLSIDTRSSINSSCTIRTSNANTNAGTRELVHASQKSQEPSDMLKRVAPLSQSNTHLQDELIRLNSLVQQLKLDLQSAVPFENYGSLFKRIGIRMQHQSERIAYLELQLEHYISRSLNACMNADRSIVDKEADWYEFMPTLVMAGVVPDHSSPPSSVDPVSTYSCSLTTKCSSLELENLDYRRKLAELKRENSKLAVQLGKKDIELSKKEKRASQSVLQKHVKDNANRKELSNRQTDQNEKPVSIKKRMSRIYYKLFKKQVSH